jgi:hypothetical protein
MPRAFLHRLTGPPAQLASSTVACGDRDAALALWDATGRDPAQLCPACWGGNGQHGARQTTPPGPITTEKAFQEAVRRLALDSSWMYYHTTDSRHSPSGYPDVTLVKGDRLLFAELKMPGKRPTMAQQAWLDALAGVTHVQACVWTPDDLEAMLGVLRCETL